MPKRQQLFSHLVGWLDLLAWQAGTAGTAYFFSTVFLGLVALCDASYVIENWHATVACIIGTFLAIPANVFVRGLAWMESLLFLIIVLGFVAVLIILLVLGPK